MDTDVCCRTTFWCISRNGIIYSGYSGLSAEMESYIEVKKKVSIDKVIIPEGYIIHVDNCNVMQAVTHEMQNILT
jgi:hypothetical protein